MEWPFWSMRTLSRPRPQMQASHHGAAKRRCVNSWRATASGEGSASCRSDPASGASVGTSRGLSDTDRCLSLCNNGCHSSPPSSPPLPRPARVAANRPDIPALPHPDVVPRDDGLPRHKQST